MTTTPPFHRIFAALLVAASLSLSACGSPPPPPDTPQEASVRGRILPATMSGGDMLAEIKRASQTAPRTKESATPSPRKTSAPRSDVCRTAIAEATTKHGIPDGLLLAIAAARGNEMLSPFVVGGETPDDTIVFQTAKDARNAARKQTSKDRTTRLGCLLVYLQGHKAWLSVDQALDPSANVDYFASYLARLKEKGRTWTEAVGRAYSRFGWKQKVHVCAVSRAYARAKGSPEPKCPY